MSNSAQIKSRARKPKVAPLSPHINVTVDEAEVELERTKRFHEQEKDPDRWSDLDLEPFRVAQDLATLSAEGKGAKGSHTKVRTRRVRVVSEPAFPLSEHPRTISRRLRRTFVFDRG